MSNDTRAAPSGTDKKTVSTPMAREDLEQVAGGIDLLSKERNKPERDGYKPGNNTEGLKLSAT